MRSRKVIVDKISSWLGCKEGDATHKHIIDTYNNHKPLARGYKVKYTDSWCATTVSATAIECGYTDIIPTECSCQQMITLLKNKGIWVENDEYIPKSGDIIFYDWQDSGVGDNVGWSDHVGIVEKCDGNIIVVIEGNKNDGVEKRSIQVNGKYIRGFGVPKYDKSPSVSTTPTTATTEKKVTPTNTIMKGVKGIDLSSCQTSVDFAKVKKAGYQFAILRSTTKNGKPDTKFEKYWHDATAAGVKIAGVYKLCYAKTVAEAEKEATGVIKLLNGRKVDIWLDLENDGGQRGYSKGALSYIITAFLTTCVNAGYNVGIYCNVDWYNNCISDDIKNICRFWIARYPKKENDDGTIHENLRTRFKGQVMWQYSSQGQINGVLAPPYNYVDLDVMC